MKKLILLFTTITIVFSLLCLASPKVEADENEDAAIAARLKAVFEDEKTTNHGGDEFVLKGQAASRDTYLLRQYLDSNRNSDLWNHFAGVYIDEEKQMVILLNCENDECKETLSKIGFENDYIIKQCEGSYFINHDISLKIGQTLSEIWNRVSNGEGTEEEKELMEYQPTTIFSDKENKIRVLLVSDTTDELAVAKSIFKKLVGDYDCLIFESAKEEDVTFDHYYYPVQSGCGIMTSGGYLYSVGYRARYLSNHIYVNGIVTSAHGNAIGQTVYLLPFSTSTPLNIGSITIREYSSYADSSFVQLSGNYQGDNSVYYTDAFGGTSNGITLSSYYSTVAVGDTVYKSGRSTYLTSGEVYSTGFNGTINGLNMIDLFMVFEQIAQPGDSGGIAFVTTNGSSGRAVGIVEGGNSLITLFQKLPPTFLYLGVRMY